ncbi:MAG: MFS transporter [Lentisphaeria bacterium]|nr:MFS transporter [Lentisphaeria bacterium]
MKLKGADIFRRDSGAGAFFLSILVWGVGTGCFAAALNNFLSEICFMDSVGRGWLELFREMPGLLLVVLFAILHRVTDWRILRIGTMLSMVGSAMLLCKGNQIYVTGAIMMWSLGEHLIMPVRQAIAMQVAKPEHAGQSLGLLTSTMNFGSVAGSLIVAVIFFAGSRFGDLSGRVLFNVVWGLVAVLMIVSAISTFTKNAPDVKAKRPKLYFNWKFRKFYALELFYGARKQFFMTFAPYVLIKVYGFSTAQMALLLGICAAVNIFAAPVVGKITDKVGYRNVMIWDTVILFFVCLLYGFADKLFSMKIALCVVCVNYLLDAIISTTSLATNIYLKTLADTQDELTSSMSTGISINHLISVIVGPLGGIVWAHYGVGTLFCFSAVMAVFNSIFAYTLPKNK